MSIGKNIVILVAASPAAEKPYQLKLESDVKTLKANGEDLAFVTVSGSPPLFVIITAHPFAEASRLVLPNGSSHLEQTTDIEVFLKIFFVAFTC